MIPNRTYFSATSDVIAEETGYWGTLSDEQWDTVRALISELTPTKSFSK